MCVCKYVSACVCVCVCAIAHYANYLHEFSILVKRFGALLGHKGEVGYIKKYD